MKCNNCGYDNEQSARFCCGCGIPTTQQPATYRPQETQSPSNGYQQPIGIPQQARTVPAAIVGTVASILGLFFLGIPLGILGIVFGYIALNNINRYPQSLKGTGLCWTAMCLGIIDIIGTLSFS